MSGGGWTLAAGEELPVARYTLASALLLLLFGWLQFQVPGLIEYDGYFHITFSRLLGQQGFIDKLPWLHFTIHRDHFRDHHLLWHYLLIPFTGGDLILGGKIAVVLFCTAAGLALYHLLRRAEVKEPLAWTALALLSSSPFLYRVSMLRVQSVSLALLLFVFHGCLKRKGFPLLIAALLFVWTYDAFVLLLIIALFFAIAGVVTGQGDGAWRPLLWVGAGVVLGMVINPYFPDNLTSLLYNARRSIFLDIPAMSLGNEWSPYDSWFMVKSSLPAFILLLATLLVLPLVKEVRSEEYAGLLLNLFFLVLMMKSRRFAEYWPVFAVLSAALVIGRRLAGRSLLLLVLLMVPLMRSNIMATAEEINDSPAIELYQGAAQWLAAHSEEGEVIFHADWDDFPFLFFCNQKNRYLVGLDPMYMYTFDSAKYLRYREITRGQVENPAAVIRQEFGCRFIFLDRREHRDFFERLERDPKAKRVYEDDGAYVYALRLGEGSER